MTKWDEIAAADPALRCALELAETQAKGIAALRKIKELVGEYPYIRCPQHGTLLLTAAEYLKQMADADARWLCPQCGSTCWWVGDDVG